MPARYAILDLETRCHVQLAREVLHLEATVDPVEVVRRLGERRRADTGGSDFQKLPFHEPVAAAILLAERKGRAPDGPIVGTDWRCWKGETPMDKFVERFFQNLAGRIYVGFNSQAFDLPLMELWASRCRVASPDHFSEKADGPRGRHSSRHYDLQKELANRAWGGGSFDELCKFHGLPGKPGVSGEDVEAMVAAGRLDEVHAYNVTDVLQSFLLLLHARVRAGDLTRAAAAESAQGVLRLTREKVVARLTPQGPAAGILERTLDGCTRAPISSGS